MTVCDASSLFSLWRAASEMEAAKIPWVQMLTVQEREHVVPALRVMQVDAGAWVGLAGRSAQYWVGVLDGLLRMQLPEGVRNYGAGAIGVAPSGWFAEGELLQRAPYRHNIQALRKSVVAGVPVEVFHWLLEHSLGFNRFVIGLLQERLMQAIDPIDAGRSNPDVRVARCLAQLCNPVLQPLAGSVLRITQQELAQLVGLSRQRVNEALAMLQAHGVIHVAYGGVSVRDFMALRTGNFVAQATSVA